jgi:signal transduction histidine kinase
MTPIILLSILAGALAIVAIRLLFGLASWRKKALRLEGELVTAGVREGDLRELLSSTVDGLLSWRAGRIVEATGLLADIGSKRGPAAAAFVALRELFHEEERETIDDALAQLHNTGGHLTRMVRAANGDTWYQVSMKRFGAEQGLSILWLQENSEFAQRAQQLRQVIENSRHSEAVLERFIDRLPVPLYRRDRNLNITWCNRAYAEMTGLESNKDPEKLRLAEIETGMTRDAGRRLAAEARRSGNLEEDIRHYVYNGQRRALRVTELPSGDDDGLIGFLRDVTDIEEKDGELRRHIDANAEVLNNLSTAITIYGSDQRLNYHNEAHSRLWGLSEDWLAGRPTYGEVLDRLREDRKLPEVTDFPAFKSALLQNFTDLLQTQEDVLYLPDGRVLRNVISPHPFGGLLVLAEDITDSLALERSVNTLTAVQRETLDNLYEGVAVFGSDARLKLFNAAYARLWNLNASELISEPHIATIVEATRQWLEDPDAEEDWETQQLAFQAQVTSRENLAGRMERPDDTVIDYTSVALPDGNKLFTYLDVTDSVAVERALRERNLALEAADQIKSEFLASVSYELRTPLNVIIGFAEVLVYQHFGELNEQQLEYGQDILNSSQQLLSLINDILDLASIEAGRLVLEPSEIDVQNLLESVVALARERAQRGQLTLAMEFDENADTLHADEKRIKQVMFNLLTNALKYTDPGGKVSVGVRRNGDWMSFYVSDTGVGIAEEDREIVFDSFRQGRRANFEHSAGLGLSLVKRFVELHHGTIELTSELGTGTTITINLPVHQEIADHEDAPSADREAVQI